MLSAPSELTNNFKRRVCFWLQISQNVAKSQ